MREQFDRLRCLCDFLEKAISKEAKRRRANAQRRYNKAKSEEERGFISVGIDDSLFEIGRDFPRVVRYSLFVSMMSMTEASLVRLCRVAHANLKLGKAFDAKGKDVIQRALEYLKVEAGLDISRMAYDKQLASDLRCLRNAIVHSEGCIKGRNNDEDAIRSFVKQRVGARIDKRNNIVMSKRFVMNNAHGMSRLIAMLFDKLRKKLDADTTTRLSPLQRLEIW